MNRQMKFGVAVAFALMLSPILCAPALAGTVVVSSACNGTGMQGTYSEAGVTAKFEACPTGGGVTYAKYMKFNNDPIVEVRVSNGTWTVLIGGIEYTDSLTDNERAQMNAAMGSAEGQIAPFTYPALVALGVDSSTSPMTALGAIAIVYEDGDHPGGSETQGKHPCTNPATNCRGCCVSGQAKAFFSNGPEF